MTVMRIAGPWPNTKLAVPGFDHMIKLCYETILEWIFHLVVFSPSNQVEPVPNKGQRRRPSVAAEYLPLRPSAVSR